MTPRWNTFSPGIPDEERIRAETIARITDWWREFEARSDDLDAHFKGRRSWDLPAWMLKHLQAIDRDLMWEFGPGLETGHRLVITPEHRLDLRPLVDDILRRAPSLDGWSFFGHRLPETEERARAAVEARTGAPLAATGFRCQKSRFNLIDLTFEFPRAFLRDHHELTQAQAFVAAEAFLGEDVLNRSIGALETDRKSWRGKRLGKLVQTVDEIQRELSAGLPRTPLCSQPDEGEWTLFELEPKAADDYPAQTDLFVAKSMNPELWENARGGMPFYSQRYSRHGEVFCYLKIDGSEDLDGELFESKGDIEDALDERLIAEGLGRFIGGGTGYRYSYVDLALTDLWKAVDAIREVLQAGQLTRRSWILFDDSEWRHEWIGVWEDSPAPPVLADASE